MTNPRDLTGQTIADGKYEVTRLIGTGGGGAVYEAKMLALGKDVALKVLDPELAHDATLRKRFLHEARTATRVEHDNVVQLFDVGKTGTGSAYIAMELLKGETLAETIDREAPMPWRRAKTIVLQICRAMHVAHTANVAHRDLKPENCYRIKRGANADYIKLLDFGLAKVFGNASNPYGSLSLVGKTFGTPEYMAPEQCDGGEVDERVDMYSLGVIMYELITGTVPFVQGDKNFIEVLRAHIEDDPVPPSAHVGSDRVTAEMDAWVLRALAKSPEGRFESMKEMAETLLAVPEALTASAPIRISGAMEAYNDGSGAELDAPRRWLDERNAKAVVALAVACVFLTLALVAVVLF